MNFKAGSAFLCDIISYAAEGVMLGSCRSSKPVLPALHQHNPKHSGNANFQGPCQPTELNYPQSFWGYCPATCSRSVRCKFQVFLMYPQFDVLSWGQWELPGGTVVRIHLSSGWDTELWVRFWVGKTSFEGKWGLWFEESWVFGVSHIILAPYC